MDEVLAMRCARAGSRCRASGVTPPCRPARWTTPTSCACSGRARCRRACASSWSCAARASSTCCTPRGPGCIASSSRASRCVPCGACPRPDSAERQGCAGPASRGRLGIRGRIALPRPCELTEAARRPSARRRPCAAVPARPAARRGSPGPEDAQPARRHGRTCAPVRLRPRHHAGAHGRCVCVTRAARSSADLLAPAPGTPNYMAPELLRSSGTFSKQVDVYAFGVVLWEVRAPAATLLQAGPSTLGPYRSLVAACPSTATTRRRSLAKCAPASAPGSRTPRWKPPVRYLRSAAAEVGVSVAHCSD